MSPRCWALMAGLLLGLGDCRMWSVGVGERRSRDDESGASSSLKGAVVEVGGERRLVDVTADTAIAPELERADALARAGKLDVALAAHTQLMGKASDNEEVHFNYGHLLARMVGPMRRWWSTKRRSSCCPRMLRRTTTSGISW